MKDAFCDIVQETISYIEKFDSQFGSSSSWTQVYATEAEYYLIQEVLFDMAYDAELGILPQVESDLYDIFSLAWARVHLLPTTPSGASRGRKVAPLRKEMQDLFFSRVADKLKQRLCLLPCHIDLQFVDNPRRLLVCKLSTALRLRDMQSKFIETISLICSVASKLFSDVRNRVQSKANLHVASVLVEEAKCLLAQATNLRYRITLNARKPCTHLNQLVQSRITLCSELRQLRTEVDGLERTLDAYRSQDSQYHDMVSRYRECQRQIEVRKGVLEQKDASSHSSFHPTRPRNRRSLSLNSLPNAMNRF
ncbi:unnamed protein product [Dicrocoelium dendriticum]|nr:unnamed protein product [Dicrocoelium dendriticum]